MDHYTAALKKKTKTTKKPTKQKKRHLVGKSFLFYDYFFIGEHLCFKTTGNWNTTVTAHTPWRWFKYYIYVTIIYERGQHTVMWYWAFSYQNNLQLYVMLTPVRKLDPRISHCLVRSKRSADPYSELGNLFLPLHMKGLRFSHWFVYLSHTLPLSEPTEQQ